MSVFEHAGFACEFAGGGRDKRRSGGRKSSVSVWISAYEFALYTDKQEFKIDGTGHIVLRPALPVLFSNFSLQVRTIPSISCR